MRQILRRRLGLGEPARGSRLRPAVESWQDLPLLLLTIGAAATSIAALLLHAAHWIRMPYTISFATLPGLVTIVCIAIWAGLSDRKLMFNRIAVGTTAGTMGLLAYDLSRLLFQILLPGHFSAFYSITAFGSLITGQRPTTYFAVVLGWAYHVSNGLTFAIIYSLLAGPIRWWYGLIMATILELGMLLVYPSMPLLRPSSFGVFVATSIGGHAAYGAVVGLSCERHAASDASPAGIGTCIG